MPLYVNGRLPSDTGGGGGGTSDFLTTADKDLTPLATSGNGSSSGLAISSTPANNSEVMVHVNGPKVSLGDGVKTKDCYFSGDAGVTARNISGITAGDVLYWNGLVAGYDLAATDEVDFDYIVSV